MEDKEKYLVIRLDELKEILTHGEKDDVDYYLNRIDEISGNGKRYYRVEQVSDGEDCMNGVSNRTK